MYGIHLRLNTFKHMYKTKFWLNIKKLNLFCKNKRLLKLLFHDFISTKTDISDTGSIMNENQNLLKPEVLRIFKNVTKLKIICGEYPIALESLLTLIIQNNIEEVELHGEKWLLSVKLETSFDLISSKYNKANYYLEFHIQEKDIDDFITILEIWRSDALNPDLRSVPLVPC